MKPNKSIANIIDNTKNTLQKTKYKKHNCSKNTIFNQKYRKNRENVKEKRKNTIKNFFYFKK
jgi:hypothetical protein